MGENCRHLSPAYQTRKAMDELAFYINEGLDKFVAETGFGVERIDCINHYGLNGIKRSIVVDISLTTEKLRRY